MGFKQTDLVSPSGVTATTPPGKQTLNKLFQLSRTDTVASIKLVLPANASIISIRGYGVASDAGTTATVSIGSTSSSNEYVNGSDVKGAGTAPAFTLVGTALAQIESLPQGADLPIYAKYAETGGASTVGGPWKILVTYVQ